MTSTEADDMVEVVVDAIQSALRLAGFGVPTDRLRPVARAAIAALRDRMPGLAWRPIDDGARSGLRILVGLKDHTYSLVARWAPAHWTSAVWVSHSGMRYQTGAFDRYIPLNPATGLPMGRVGAPIVQPAAPTHRHYKGGLYRELHRATDEVSLSPCVVYQAMSDGRIWVRTADLFDGMVVPTYGASARRFEPIAQAEAQQVETPHRDLTASETKALDAALWDSVAVVDPLAALPAMPEDPPPT